ncbi:MAG: PRC-barrel domain-containing protein, partial [Actinomycetospora chiangmaiensis]|nr:PRC-barrel domain-containing protein [Actinomycetospora chiangmaiensis]
MKTISAATALLLLATTTAPLLAADSMPTNAGDALAQQGPDLWRGSKLVGVAIYGPGDKKVGDINDVLMNHDGKATYVVIGVGGFLG